MAGRRAARPDAIRLGRTQSVGRETLRFRLSLAETRNVQSRVRAVGRTARVADCGAKCRRRASSECRCSGGVAGRTTRGAHTRCARNYHIATRDSRGCSHATRREYHRPVPLHIGLAASGAEHRRVVESVWRTDDAPRFPRAFPTRATQQNGVRWPRKLRRDDLEHGYRCARCGGVSQVRAALACGCSSHRHLVVGTRNATGRVARSRRWCR